MRLEDTEDLLDGEGSVDSGLVLKDVESDGLGKGSALANGHDVAFLYVDEGRRDVHGEVAVSLLESSVLSNILQVISSADNGSLHFVGDNHALEDTTADRNVASEGALLVDVVAYILDVAS